MPTNRGDKKTNSPKVGKETAKENKTKQPPITQAKATNSPTKTNGATTKTTSSKNAKTATQTTSARQDNVLEFRAESKRLLDLMINSVYSNKEIFLRELISNASDALDKLYFQSLTDDKIKITKDDLAIEIVRDPKNRILRIRDNGIGMTQQELDNNLGTIAKSGSKAFKDDLKNAQSTQNTTQSDPSNQAKDDQSTNTTDQNITTQKDIDIIGQFGVGFYSSFMVADKVSVISKTQHSKPYLWTSEGLNGYTLQEFDIQNPEHSALVEQPSDAVQGSSSANGGDPTQSGTEIILHLKADEAGEDGYQFSKFLDEYELTELVKKHSDYIRYPIKTAVTKHIREESKDGKEGEYTEKQVVETINSMVPIWKKRKSEVTQEDYNNFYYEKFHDYQAPLTVISTHINDMQDFDTLLFIPSNAPYNYYSKDYTKGLKLYASGVLITDTCSELLPDYFGFVKGVVDSRDLSLNISRELLQQDRQLKTIAKHIEKHIKQELVKLQTDKREDYDKFFKNFGLSLKFGAYERFGHNKENLKDLLMFYSSTQKKLTTFAEYVERMKLGQEHIYYATGESVESIDRLPSCELLKDKEYEILYLTDNVDEFVLKVLESYNDKKFMSTADPNLKIGDDIVGDNAGLSSQHKDLLDTLKELLKDKVEDVILSTRLKTYAVCLTAKGEVSIEMEKTLSQINNGQQGVKAQKVLEINPNHAILQNLIAQKQNKDYLAKMSNILYTTARMIEGLPVDDAVTYAENLFSLMQ